MKTDYQGNERPGGHSRLPSRLKSALEQLSGYSMDDVTVHYNSVRPARLQALAYAYGNDIFIGPGQEHCLAHEAWHVIQQKQGRVQANSPWKNTLINKDADLEDEADSMGAIALKMEDTCTTQMPKHIPSSQMSRAIQCTIDKDFRTPIRDLVELNAAAGRLNPAVAPLALATFAVHGSNLTMVNRAIAANMDTIYDGMSQADIAGMFTEALTVLVNTVVPNYTFESHGLIHFPGGSAKDQSKFTGRTDQVNPLLQAVMTSQIGRMRRYATADHVQFYLTFLPSKPQPLANYCNGNPVAIQITYSRVTDTISYHGYPDSHIRVYKLAPTRDGLAIPM